jgi:hypothetical protein
MYKVAVEGFLGIALIAHQTVLLHPCKDGLLTDLRDFLASLVSLYPYDVLASLETPFLKQLSSILQVIGACPQKDEGRTITDISHTHLLQLL